MVLRALVDLVDLVSPPRPVPTNLPMDRHLVTYFRLITLVPQKLGIKRELFLFAVFDYQNNLVTFHNRAAYLLLFGATGEHRAAQYHTYYRCQTAH